MLLSAEKKAQRDSAFGELYSRYGQRVFAYIRKITGNPSATDDLFQECWMRFLKVGEAGTEVQNVPSYLLRIARNLCFNYLNSSNYHFVEFEDFHRSSESDNYANRELAELAEKAMELLPEEHKEAFVLQTYSNMSYQEIADVQQVPLTTVRNRVVRAKAKLQKILSSYLVEYSETTDSKRADPTPTNSENSHEEGNIR